MCWVGRPEEMILKVYEVLTGGGRASSFPKPCSVLLHDRYYTPKNDCKIKVSDLIIAVVCN